MEPVPYFRISRRVALTFLLAGLALAVMSGSGVFPMVSLAHVASSDGVLTPPFVALLQRSQWTMTVILLFMALLCLGTHKLYDTRREHLLGLTDRTFSIALGVCAFAAAWMVQTFVFGGIPHVTDAISHWFEAKILCLGRIWVPTPTCEDHFAQHNIVMSFDGKWHTKYFPGQALWLALGMKPGIVSAIMPLAFSICVVSFVRVLRRLFDRFFARISGVLFLTSPMCLLLGGSFMSHITFLMFALASLAAMTCLCDDHGSHRRRAWFVLPGFLFGMALLTRPQDFLLLVLFLIAAFVVLPTKIRSQLGQGAPAALAGFALPLAFLLAWNHTLYGQCFATGYNFSNGPSPGLVKHDSLGFSDGYTPAVATGNMIWTVLRFNKALFGWPASLLFVSLAFLHNPFDRRTLISTGMITACIGMYFFFPYYGFEYEARYYTAAVPFAIVLTVQGLRNILTPATRGAVFAIVMVSFLHALSFYWPFYVWPVYSQRYEQTSEVLEQLAQRDDLRNAVVLIDSTGEDNFRYSSGFVYNDPLLTNSVIYARDIPEMNDCLFGEFPARKIFRFIPNADWTDGRFEEMARPE